MSDAEDFIQVPRAMLDRVVKETADNVQAFAKAQASLARLANDAKQVRELTIYLAEKHRERGRLLIASAVLNLGLGALLAWAWP